MDTSDKAKQGFDQDQKGKSVDRNTELEIQQADEVAENDHQQETADKIQEQLPGDRETKGEATRRKG